MTLHFLMLADELVGVKPKLGCRRRLSPTRSSAQSVVTCSTTFGTAGTDAVRSRVYPHIADAILGHGVKKKALQAPYLSPRDDVLIQAIDIMKSDIGESEIRVGKSRSA